jgi:hypothetical protein
MKKYNIYIYNISYTDLDLIKIMGNSKSSIHNEVTTNILNESITDLVNDNKITATASASTDQTGITVSGGTGDVNITGDINQDAKIIVDIDATVTKLSKMNLATELSATVSAKLDSMNKNQEPIIPGSSTDTNTVNIIKNNITNIIKTKVKNIDATTCSANARASQDGIVVKDQDGVVTYTGTINQSITIEAIAKCIVSDTDIIEIANEMVAKTEVDIKNENENKNFASAMLDSIFDGLTNIFGALTMPFIIGMCLLVVGFLIWWMNGGQEAASEGMARVSEHKKMQMEAPFRAAQTAAQFVPQQGQPNKYQTAAGFDKLTVFLNHVSWWR